MPKKINYTLTTEQLQIIETAVKSHPNLRVRKRAQMIRLLHQGHKPAAIGEMIGVTGALVYYWHARWRESGLAGLVDKQRPGRPKAGGDEYRQKLEVIIETDPHTLGYGFNVWTTQRLLQHMEHETGVIVHENTLRNMLEELDYVFRRPRHELGNLQDEKAKVIAQDILEDLKKSRKRRNRTILCGRNELETIVNSRQMLDETGATKAHCLSTFVKIAAFDWGLQLAHRGTHLYFL